MPEGLEQTTLAESTAEIVSAYVFYNQNTPPNLGIPVSTVAGELRMVITSVEQPAELTMRRSVQTTSCA